MASINKNEDCLRAGGCLGNPCLLCGELKVMRFNHYPAVMSTTLKVIKFNHATPQDDEKEVDE